ncbi:MAG: ABC transporter ATP-binding protein [Elusimicrobia bacterium]|nr:MAG: ABC transporter ATP-binding protein [Elusimicrobiota bacterium]
MGFTSYAAVSTQVERWGLNCRDTSIRAIMGANRAEAKKKIAEAKAILMGLGFKEGDFAKPVGELSGGWAMRVSMARLLIDEPDMLLLDEPTNHLDLESLLWFQEYLEVYPGAIFLISHDRDFINTICNAIVSVQNYTLKVYRGDYDYFLREKDNEAKLLVKAFNEQKAEIAEMEDFIARNRVRASTASRAQSMIKRLSKLERIVLPDQDKKIKIRFPQPERVGVRAIALKGLYKSYDDVKVYENLDFEIERGFKMAFVGHNGAGKSTLLKVLAGEIPFEKGERKIGLNVKVGYFSQHRAHQFMQNRTVLKEAMDNDRLNPELMVRTVLGTFLFEGDRAYKKTSVLSGGEKSRLALAKLLLDPPNVLLLDEPTTHLDMNSVDALIVALKGFEGTICVISHDVYFINQLCSHVVHVDHGHVTVYPGNYDYFLHRQHQKEAEVAASSGGKGAAAAQAAAKLSEKDYRKQKSESREKERTLKRLESSLEEGHQKLEELAESLGDPKVYEDFALSQKIGDEIQALQDSIQAQETELGRLRS